MTNQQIIHVLAILAFLHRKNDDKQQMSWWVRDQNCYHYFFQHL